MKTTLKFWAFRILEDCPHFGISQLLERAPQKIIEALGASLSRAMLRKEAKRQARIKKRREATRLSNESGDNQ